MSPVLTLFMTLFLTLSLPAGVCLAQNVRDLTVSGFRLGDSGESVKERIRAMNMGYEFFDFIPVEKVESELQYTGFLAIVYDDRQYPDCSEDNCPYLMKVYTLSDGRVWQLDESVTVRKKEDMRQSRPFFLEIAKRYGEQAKVAYDEYSGEWAYDEQGDFMPWTIFTDWNSLNPEQSRADSYYFACSTDNIPKGSAEVAAIGEFSVLVYKDECQYYATFNLWGEDGLTEFYNLNLVDAKARREDVARLTQEKAAKGEKNRGKPDRKRTVSGKPDR
jgi:hypothetical protein